MDIPQTADVTGRIHSTESFGTVDGPGVRFVVFFQGCPMRCRYCHNPDTWDMNGGETVSVGTLCEMYERNRPFYKNGGITATGGEPMAQLPFLTALFQHMHARGVHTCLDTSGICFDPAHPERIRPLLPVTDLVMLDIKHIDDDRHRALTGHSNQNILAFARFLSEQGVPLWVRHVIVPGWTDDPDEQRRLGQMLRSFQTLRGLDVLPYHDLGKPKYEALGLPYPLPDAEPVSKEQARDAYQTILRGISGKN